MSFHFNRNLDSIPISESELEIIKNTAVGQAHI